MQSIHHDLDTILLQSIIAAARTAGVSREHPLISGGAVRGTNSPPATLVSKYLLSLDQPFYLSLAAVSFRSKLGQMNE